MNSRFAAKRMSSLRDRFRPKGPATAAAQDPKAEARASQALASSRGRAPIAPAPKAGKAVAALARSILPQTGLGIAEMKRRWAEIVGPSYADKTSPEKITAGVLTLRAPSALAPFLQQQAPLLIERLKLAGAKVKTIKIEHRGPVVRPNGNVRPMHKAISAAEETALAQSLDRVPDAGLKSALLRLGRAMKQG
jgi:hypothetical protein